MEEIVNLPKVVLHLHLDGSVRVSTANELLNKDVERDMIVDSNCKDLNEYLKKFDIPISIMQSKSNLERISYELALDLKNDNVIYAEVRFAPIFHTKCGLSLEEVVESVLNGFKKVDIKINLILCMMRGMSYLDNEKIIYLAKKYLNNGVCGIDLAGAEALYKTKDYEDLFKLSTKLDIPFTIHAGEADGADSIKSALSFGTKRLGHGVKCVESEDLIDRINNENITLEVCPTSNLDTCIVDVYSNHPIKKLYDKGVRVTINTDNNTVSNVTLTDEYRKLIKYFDFKKEDFYNFNVNAIECAFISDEEKDSLKNILKKAYNK